MYDIIGDVHGCMYELQLLFEKLGYKQKKNGFVSPDDRIAVFVGDLVDRGRSSVTVLNLVKDMVRRGLALAVRGNHDDKLMRWAQGRNVTLSHGLKKTVWQVEKAGMKRQEVVDFIGNIPYFQLLDDNKLVVTHGAWKDNYMDMSPFSKKCRTWCLFMPNKGLGSDGYPIRIDWASERVLTEKSPIIVYGHQPYKEVREKNKTYGIDTGCVFGNKLTALRYPEMEFVQVDAQETYAQAGRWGEP